MKFSENLRNLRKEKDYSQEYLAEVMHVSRQTVSKWENGSAMPDLKKLTELAEFFGTSMDTLLGIEGTEESSNKIDMTHYNYYLQQLEARYDELIERKEREFQRKWRGLLWSEVIVVLLIVCIFTSTRFDYRNKIAGLEEQVDYLQSEQEYQKQSEVDETDFVEHEILSVDKEQPYIVTVRYTYAPEEYTNGSKVYFTKKVGKKTYKYEAKATDGKFVAEFTVNLTEENYCSIIINNGVSTKTADLSAEFGVPFAYDFLKINANCYYYAQFETRNSEAPYAIEFCDNNFGQNICLSTEFSGKIKAARLIVMDYAENQSGKEIYSKKLKVKKNNTDYIGDTQIILPTKLELTDYSNINSLCIYAELTGEDGTVYWLAFNAFGDDTSDETTFDLSGYDSDISIRFPDGTMVGDAVTNS